VLEDRASRRETYLVILPFVVGGRRHLLIETVRVAREDEMLVQQLRVVVERG
jgi:hypothetical protein